MTTPTSTRARAEAGPPWTSPDDIAARVRRRWDDGSLLRAVADGETFEPIDVAIRGPKPSQIGDDLAAVRTWIAKLDAGSRSGTRYTLRWASVGGRSIGRNELPVRAVIATAEQAWALLGVTVQVSRYQAVLERTGPHAGVRAWVVAQPLKALELHAELPRLIAAYDWLDAHRGCGWYLRQISAPGVDTKFTEQHRGVLAAMLGVPSSGPGFLAGLGLRAKPEFVRLRPAPSLGLPRPLTELALRADELRQLAVAPATVVVVENEITYLSVPVPHDGAVLWGKGFDVDVVGRLPWLAGADVVYWGDIDTHGFAILDRLRARQPQTRSVLMDRDTLLSHRERWGSEHRPTAAALTRLTAPEQALYADLVADTLGPGVRLEQERIDWSWAEQRCDYPRQSGAEPPTVSASRPGGPV